MINYIGTKKVQAQPMNEYEAVQLGYARPNEDNHEWREGYHVVYEDGYHSWSPKNVFESAYEKNETVLDRIVIESDELYEKIHKLEQFRKTDRHDALPVEHRSLLRIQHTVMEVYYNILKERIDLMSSRDFKPNKLSGRPPLEYDCNCVEGTC